MKKYLSILAGSAALFFSTFAFINKSSTGMSGFTGSPGEATCTNCHSGGSSAASGLTINAVPAFTNNLYMADSTYQINITVGATGFSRFGFGAEILDSVQNDAGTIQNAGSGVKFQTTFNGRKNAIHTTKKAGANAATFSFQWVAPSSGKVEIYACGNAVNNNNNTSGDLPIPGSLFLYPAPVVPQDTAILTGLEKNSVVLKQVSVFPNPGSEKITVSYFLKTKKRISMVLVNINGTESFALSDKNQESGFCSEIISLPAISPGVYFLRISADGKQMASKLLAIQ